LDPRISPSLKTNSILFSILSIVFGFQFPCFGEENLKVSFDRLPELVKIGNQNIKAKKLSLKASETLVGHYGRSFMPTVNAAAGMESFQTGAFSTNTQPYGSIEATVNLYRGGRDQLEEQIIKMAVKSGSAENRVTYLDELTHARELFWELVHVKEHRNLYVKSLAQNKKNLMKANVRIRKGLSTKTDRLEFEINKSLIEEQINRLNQKQKLVETNLRIVLGTNSDIQIETISYISHNHYDSLLKEGFKPKSHPAILDLLAKKDALMAKSNQLKSWWLPTLDTYAGYSLFTMREKEDVSIKDRDEIAVGLRLSFTLFDGFNSKKEALSHSIMAESLGIEAHQKESILKSEIDVLRRELVYHHSRVHKLEDRTRLAKRYLKSTLNEYSRGVKNSPDVLEASERFYETEYTSSEIRKEYELARVALLKLLGK